MILDGKKLAVEILARAKARASKLPRRPKVAAYAFSDTPATRSYLSIKAKSAEAAGCDFEVRKDLPIRLDGDAILMQLPLPKGMDIRILDQIPFEKDADILSPAARAVFERGDERALLPPVIGAVKEILHCAAADPKGKPAIVIGLGFLVGHPAAVWLAQQGAKVIVADDKTKNLGELVALADIIVSGAGVPRLIKPEMLKEGVILIDAGTSELDGTIVGDADPACAPKCSLFTPVPGGIGPVAVACLFNNAVELASRIK